MICTGFGSKAFGDSGAGFLQRRKETKGNVFPEEMLKDPQKAICMFVKKKEVDN